MKAYIKKWLFFLFALCLIAVSLPTSSVAANTYNTDVITRADMEEALVEVAWSYYMLGSKYQYDNVSLNNRAALHKNDPLCGYCGGYSRIALEATPEKASSDKAMYTVCSGFCYDVYKEAFDYPILGNKFNCLTMTLWRNSSYPEDMAILRWHSKGDGNLYNDYDTEFNVSYDGCWYDADEVYTFFQNYETTMRPGDIVVFDNPGHAMLYVGNGVILDANGGKYKMETGLDFWESDGTIDYNTIEGYYLNPNNSNFFVGDLASSTKTNSIVVVRPLNLLTVDDGDNDLGNDVLDTSYVLNISPLKTNLDFDNSPIKTTGFTIEDSAYIRIQYPAMNIDRTVNITPFGTAVQGENITYTLAITNHSNNPYYTAYHSADGTPYTGTAYQGLPVTEVIPSNTAFVSATGNFTKNGNTLQWTIDVPAGETVTLSYTVEVTGAIGGDVVCGGGSVANLPTNTITNHIGGKKLISEEAKINAFFIAGKNGWNSNHGYHISAAATEDTHFAERIYNEAFGKDLQFPDVQALANMFFTEKVFSVNGGAFYLYYNRSSITRHMYELTASAPNAADQIYYDMLVKDLYGGVWVWSDMHNGSTRTVELREDYLEIGDVLVYMNLTESASDGASAENRTVDNWRILVYLGSGRYASLSSDKRLEAVTGTAGLQAAFSYDMFICLRPSQVYADINASVGNFFISSRPTLTTADTAASSTSTTSEILLGTLATSRLAALNAEDGSWVKVNGPFIGEIYNRIGINVITDGTNDSSFATIMSNCFDSTLGTVIANKYGRDYSLKPDPVEGAEKQYDMILYYGGACFAWNKQKQLTHINELWSGDVIMMGSRQLSFYVTAIYQGNGNFLLNVQNRGNLPINEKIWKNLHFASNDDFLLWLGSSVTDMCKSLAPDSAFDPAVLGQLVFENYIVLRPSRAFADINSKLTGLRDITATTLTDAEQAVLSAILPMDYFSFSGGVNLDTVFPWLYQKAGIQIAVGAYEPKTVNSLVTLLFDTSTTPYGTVSLNTSDLAKYYQQMRVENLWGGCITDSANRKIADVTGQLQIGDLVCGRYKGSSNYYYTALYQGENFLVFHGNGGPTCEIMTAAQLDSIGLYYWYTIRPELLAQTVSDDSETASLRNILTGKLTEAEKNLISTLTIEQWQTECRSRTLQNILPWTYQSAGVDVTNHSDYTPLSVNSVKNLFAETDTTADGYAYYNEILVADSYGASVTGTGVTNMQIGDIFCGAVTVNKVLTSGTMKLYYVAIYQGAENFLALYDIHDLASDNRMEGKRIMTTSELSAMTFTYRYVLRPDQLVEPRNITASALTEEEKTAFSSITAEQWAADCNAGNLDTILNWAYSTINVDITQVNGYAAKTVHAVFNYLFELPSGASSYALKAADSAEATNIFYHNIQLTSIYGGTIFESDVNLSENLSSLQIGDVFCARLRTIVEGNNQDRYWIGLYQGNGNFLTVYTTLDGTRLCEVKTASELDATIFQYYYVLRPEQLCNDHSSVIPA